MESTEDFLTEILNIHFRVCTLDLDDYSSLSELTSIYRDFLYRNATSHKLHIEDSERRDTFLSKKKVGTFEALQVKLEGFLFSDILSSTLRLNGAKWNEYIFARAELNRFELAKRNNKFVLWKDFTKGSLNEITFSFLPDDYLQKLQKKIKDLKKKLSKKKILKKTELSQLEKNTLPYLEDYQRWVEAHFFDLRQFFSFYGKRVELRLSSQYWVLIYVFDGNGLSFRVYDEIPAVYSGVEHLMMLDGFRILTTSPPFEKNTNLLHLSEEGVFIEALQIFFNVSEPEDRLELMRQIFQLFGYAVSEVDEKCIQIRKVNCKIEIGAKNEFFAEHEYVFLSWNHLYGEDFDRELVAMQTFSRESAKYFFMPDAMRSIHKKLEDAGVKLLTLHSVVKKLLELGTFHFILPLIHRGILKAKKSEVDFILKRKRDGEQLISELQLVEKGHAAFKRFEKIVSRIFEYLFCDSFRSYFAAVDSEDHDGHQIRDLVISNISPKLDFWKERKQEQNAKRIIVDSKNYTSKVSKKIIHDVSQYLNKDMGNFAIVVTREGIDASGLRELKLKFKDDKLIIHLSQSDLISMIRYKMNGQVVEDVLEMKIHEMIR